MMDAFRQDLRYALKSLQRDRAYAAAVILTLAVCLGANTAIVTVVRSVLLRPLPYPESHRLLSSYDSFPGAGVERAGTSVPNYVDRRAMTGRVLSRWRSISGGDTSSARGRAAEGVSGMNVTPSFFKVLGAEPATGRLFTEAEGTPGQEQGRRREPCLRRQATRRRRRQSSGVSSAWTTKPYDVVGVLPQSFSFLSPEVRGFRAARLQPDEIWRRAAAQPEPRACSPGSRQASRSSARRHGSTRRTREVVERAGSLKGCSSRPATRTRMAARGRIVRNVRAALQMLLGGVLFVVLIAAVNIANLSLVARERPDEGACDAQRASARAAAGSRFNS